jgi:hypothetical protein
MVTGAENSEAEIYVYSGKSAAEFQKNESPAFYCPITLFGAG